MGESRLTSAPEPRAPAESLTELLARAQAGDLAARDRVVEANLRLVRSIVGRFLSSGQDPEDLFQVGCLGLLKAVDRFDLSLGLQFSTYAVPLIIGEIRRHLRDSGPVKVSRDLKRLAWEGRRKHEALAKSLGRDPTVAEVAEALSVPVDRLVEAMDGAAPPASIHDVIHQEDGDPVFLLDSLSADPKDEADPPWFERLAVRQALERLDPREYEILRLRFFHDLSQVQVSSRLGISQVHVSRLERRALGHLRQYLGAT